MDQMVADGASARPSLNKNRDRLLTAPVLKRCQRACDVCRKKKRDGDTRCNYCVKHKFVCTYVEPATTRSMRPNDPNDLTYSYEPGYIETLKRRLDIAELALQEAELHAPDQADPFTRGIRALANPFLPPHPDDSAFNDIADSFRALSLNSPGFQGKSSPAMLVTIAVGIKPFQQPAESRVYSQTPPAPKPWTLESWDKRPRDSPHFTFPADHLMQSLLSLYFSNVNPFVPLLNRSIFEEAVLQGLHFRDLSFGTVLLLVCALGSLYLTPSSKENRERMAWNWYDQVELCGHSLGHQPTLYDLQAYCLATQFLSCAGNLRSAWNIVGFGVRLAQEIGAHRKGGSVTTATAELEKRALWILLFFDTQLSGALGRSSSLEPLDIDISLPLEFDDEVESNDNPSTLAFFNCLLNLYRIVNFTLRSLYTLSLDRIQMDPSPDVPSIAAKLDWALDQWLASVPGHLRWTPNLLDAPLFCDQSAALYCFYYYTRILIHRPLIPGVLSASALPPSAMLALGICASAARACVAVASTQLDRRPDDPLSLSQTPVFTAAMLLVLNRWSGAGEVEDLQLVRKAIEVLGSQQARWPSSGFLMDILERVMCLDESEVSSTPWNNLMCDLDGFVSATIAYPSVEPGISHQFTSGHREPITSHPSQAASPEITLPPAFAGDEEIPARRVRIPRLI
ncbi:fungal-specific transcription factor domain-containing protein [Mycena olivaceomarginata]|nr:fungal-specific transcription factor domain-containing protein [Mycena olivaceomarginata]